MADNNHLLITFSNGIRTIKFNRPQKKNAICLEMYITITQLLENDANDDRIIATIFTGIGDYYSSGNELTMSALTGDNQDMHALLEARINVIRRFIEAFINYPKLLVAVVNGPAIGIAVTTLALCDAVYASEQATFQTPFIDVGLCPEGCSSFLFPRIMGRSTASEMLLFGQRLSAQDARACGLVSAVLPHAQLDGLFVKLEKLGRMPVKAVRRAKMLITAPLKERLLAVNRIETDELRKCFESDEFFEGIQRFLSRKHKL